MQGEEILKELKEVFNKNCNLCRHDYDQSSNPAMMLCLNQHICCQDCVNRLTVSKNKSIKCPFCVLTIKKDQIFKVRRFDEIIELQEKYQISNKLKFQQNYNKYKIYLRQNREKLKCYDTRLLQLEEKQNQINILYDFMIEQAKELFKQKQFELAIQILQELLLKYYKKNDQFIGLGSKQESEGYQMAQSIERSIGWGHISALDLIALCFLQSDHKKSRQFYTKMTKRFPEDYRIWFGLAITQHNQENFKIAEQLYVKVSKMIPTFDKSYQMQAFIQLKSANNKERLSKHTQTALLFNQNNIFAKYIQAVSLPKQRILQKMALLRQIIKLDPFFIRAMNQLGLIYMTDLKDFEKAEECFLQCLKINENYLFPRLNLFQCYYSMNRPKQVINLFTNYKGPIAYLNSHFTCLIGKSYVKCGNLVSGSNWLEKSKLPSEKMADFYFENQIFQKALQKYRSIKDSETIHKRVIQMKIATCLIELKKYDQALATLQNILNNYDDNQEEIIEKIVELTKLCPDKRQFFKDQKDFKKEVDSKVMARPKTASRQVSKNRSKSTTMGKRGQTNKQKWR